MERLTEYILGFAHGKKGSRLDLAEKSKTVHRGCFECSALIDRLAEYEDTELTPVEIMQLKKSDENKEDSSINYYIECKKLKEKIQETENEQLNNQLENIINLPCKIGKEVFIFNKYKNQINKGIVTHFKIEKTIVGLELKVGIRNLESYSSHSCNNHNSENLNRTWFLTLEEAEAKLKEIENEQRVNINKYPRQRRINKR